jgi:hypothetical protein
MLHSGQRAKRTQQSTEKPISMQIRKEENDHSSILLHILTKYTRRITFLHHFLYICWTEVTRCASVKHLHCIFCVLSSRAGACFCIGRGCFRYSRVCSALRSAQQTASPSIRMRSHVLTDFMEFVAEIWKKNYLYPYKFIFRSDMFNYDLIRISVCLCLALTIFVQFYTGIFYPKIVYPYKCTLK